MEPRDELENRLNSCLTEADSCPVNPPRPAPGSAMDLSNQIALLGEALNRKETEARLLKANINALKGVNRDLRAQNTGLEAAIVAQARHIAEQARQLDAWRAALGDDGEEEEEEER